jgi:cell division initiation protein
MEVSPKTLREVEFREKMRGYHPEDVDQFLEQVAAGLEVLHDRLRQAVERAQRAEAAAADSGGTDETLRRTLVLAQRTADLAVQEAREQASRILGGAEQQAQTLLADAEERARRAHDEAISEIRAELGTLEAVRQRGQQEVDLLNRWVEEHRTHLASTLKEALTVVDRAGTLSPAPTSRPIDVSYGSRTTPVASNGGGSAPSAAPALPPLSPPVVSDGGPPTVAWQVPEAEVTSSPVPVPESANEAQFGSLRRAGETDPSSWDTGPHPVVGDDPVVVDPEEAALDEFFDDGELDEDRRFGGRLRRRR